MVDKYGFILFAYLPRFILITFVINWLILHGSGFAPNKFSGVKVNRIVDGKEIDLYSEFLEKSDKESGSTLLILGTYAADFNAIEYIQRARYYFPALREKGVSRFGLLLNANPSASKELVRLLDLPSDIELLSDEKGEAGRVFGVNRGWLSEEEHSNVSPYLKLFGMLWGLGAVCTLPSVIGGYIGNPFSAQPWIEAALAQGQRSGRWPGNALELDDKGEVRLNKFSELPVVGSWKRRPLELATLRLQNMLGVSLQHWSALKPSDEALAAGVLTQLGGLLLLDPAGQISYQWRDQGICHVANFEEVLKKLSPKKK